MIAAVALLTALGTAEAAPPKAELRAAWKRYVRAFVSEDGRVIDHEAGGVTTSEGQAYAMLRAAWCDDRATFRSLRRWTRDNLQRGDEAALPAWKWGARPDGTWGVLDPNSASDADQLLAYALLVADDRWREPAMGAQARAMLGRIWDEEVVTAGPWHVLLPGAWAKLEEPLRVNPSYYLPFAWRVFAAEDPAHPWKELLDDSYEVLDTTLGPAGLPPDWAWLDRETGAPMPPPAGQEALARFGFEAFRLLWALAAEVRWHDEPRARALLQRMDGLRTRWAQAGTIPAVMEPSGLPAVEWSYLGAYGAFVPAWSVVDDRDARRLYRREIARRREAGGWGRAGDYYAQNWVWFGLALWTGYATPAPGAS